MSNAQGTTGAYRTYSSKGDGAAIKSYFIAPGAPHGAVILLRGVAGPDSGYTQIADRLSDAGYAALVHAWQTRGNDPADSVLFADLQAAIEFLRAQPALTQKPCAIFGYCKGGGFGILAAAAIPAVRAVVAFHGFARRPDGPDAAHGNPIDAVGRIQQPVLLLHGGCDQLSPVGAMRELDAALRAAGVPAQMHEYPQADHGFAVSTHKGYRAEDATDSFNRALAFLRAHLK